MNFNRSTLQASTQKAPGAEYVVWKTFVESKDLYRLLIISSFSKKPLVDIKRYYANLLASLFSLGTRVNHDQLLRLTIGAPEYLKTKLELILEKATLTEAERY